MTHPQRMALAGVLLAWALGAAAQTGPVKVFDRVPTVEELRAALPRAAAPAAAPVATANSAAQPAGGGPPRARGLVWNAAPAKVDGAMGAAAPSAHVSPAAPAAPATPQPTPAEEPAALPAVALPITFESGSSRLTRDAQAFLEPIALLLKSDPALRMQLEGHTDAIGNPRANLMLSWERAMSVMRALVERHGIEPHRLQPLGKGASEPLDGAAPDAAANRRVQLRPLA